MAIIVKLDDLLHARRMTLTELAGKVDITLANLSILKTGKARAIRFSTLSSICAALVTIVWFSGSPANGSPPPLMVCARITDGRSASRQASS